MKPTVLGIASFVAGAAVSAAVLASGSSATTSDKKAVEAIVHDYIMNNPDVIVESVKKWQEGEAGRQAEAAKDNIKKYHDEIYNNKNDAYGGNPNGDVTVVEFFDYNCPACKMMFKGLDELVKKDKNVKIVFKEMPIFGEQSNQNSMIGLAVSRLAPEKYFPFHEKMMAHEGRISADDAMRFATELGLKEEDIRNEMKSDEIGQHISDTHKLAEKLGVRGTPALVIHDTLIPSAIDYNAVAEEVKIAREKK